MIILVINCGSSSIKYQLLDMKNDDVFDIIAKGIAEKIGLPAGILQYAPTGRDKIVKDIPIADHKVGMQLILEALTDPETGVLSSLEDIEAVGHRIVQGGDFFSGSVLVDDDEGGKDEKEAAGEVDRVRGKAQEKGPGRDSGREMDCQRPDVLPLCHFRQMLCENRDNFTNFARID